MIEIIKHDEIEQFIKDFWYTVGKKEAMKDMPQFPHRHISPNRRKAYEAGFKQGEVERMLEGKKDD